MCGRTVTDPARLTNGQRPNIKSNFDKHKVFLLLTNQSLSLSNLLYIQYTGRGEASFLTSCRPVRNFRNLKCLPKFTSHTAMKSQVGGAMFLTVMYERTCLELMRVFGAFIEFVLTSTLAPREISFIYFIYFFFIRSLICSLFVTSGTFGILATVSVRVARAIRGSNVKQVCSRPCHV